MLLDDANSVKSHANAIGSVECQQSREDIHQLTTSEAIKAAAFPMNQQRNSEKQCSRLQNQIEYAMLSYSVELLVLGWFD